jgi:RNA polymerase sigma-70 factor, ECF subfamily
MLEGCFGSVLAAAVDGDEQAFARLWRDLHPALLRYLQVVAPGAAEDVASETWVEVVRGLGRFVGDETGFGPGCSPSPGTAPWMIVGAVRAGSP